MLKTTLALKDEGSSDTVSTEHNYLLPTVARNLRKLEGVNQQASINTSSNNGGGGNIIHVQEQNIDTEGREFDNRRIHLVNKESQIMFDTPSKMHIVGSPLGQAPPTSSQLS